jgi:hypothetical protein
MVILFYNTESWYYCEMAVNYPVKSFIALATGFVLLGLCVNTWLVSAVLEYMDTFQYLPTSVKNVLGLRQFFFRSQIGIVLSCAKSLHFSCTFQNILGQIMKDTYTCKMRHVQRDSSIYIERERERKHALPEHCMH